MNDDDINTYGGLDRFILPVMIVVVWFIIADVLQLFPVYILPGPVEVVQSLIDQLFSGKLVSGIFNTVYKVIIGLILPIVVGVVSGILIGWYKRLERLFSVIISIFRHIPPVVWIPFSMLWFGIGLRPGMFVIFIGCVFTIILNTIDGVHNTKQEYIETALTFGATDFQIITDVIFPSAIPNILSGIKLIIPVSLIITLAGEMIGSYTGVGYMILTSANLYDSASTVVGMLEICLIAIVLEYIVTKIQEQIFW